MSWLWRSDSSPASFEKALSRLSSQISATNVSLDQSRSRARRAKALWTLYTTLAYLVSALIVLLVIGPQEGGLPHYAGLIGGPVIIYGGRKAITAVFGWTISRQQSHLDRLQKQREEKIAELKKATRYDSTQELLTKYGGAPQKKKQQEEEKQDGQKKQQKQTQSQMPVQRTGLSPPPTANIPGRITMPPSQSRPHSPQAMYATPVEVQVDEPGFAPNAFSQPPPPPSAYQQGIQPESHWYDRILDVMLGEDETLAKNRLVMLCSNPSCKLVNGQAPPGVKTLEELGRWRCQACGRWNGVEPQSEVAELVKDPEASNKPVAHEDEDDVKCDSAQETQSLGEQDGATGHDAGEGGASVKKRVTRSAGKAESDGL